MSNCLIVQNWQTVCACTLWEYMPSYGGVIGGFRLVHSQILHISQPALTCSLLKALHSIDFVTQFFFSSSRAASTDYF